MIIISGIFYYDVNVYRYGEEYKVVYLKRFQPDEYHLHKEFDDSNKLIGNKFESNIARARATVLAHALCNPWDYFTTFTLNPEKYDRTDLKLWMKDFTHWIRNQRRNGDEWKYLLIPEWHESTITKGLFAWHMHGLVKGLEWDKLKEFDPSIHPLKLVKKNYRYHPVINEKFGFCSFGLIRDKTAVSKYTTKYITKTMAESNMDVGAHLYYASQGLNKPELIKQGISTSVGFKPDFKNDFMCTKWIDLNGVYRIVGDLIC